MKIRLEQRHFIPKIIWDNGLFVIENIFAPFSPQ